MMLTPTVSTPEGTPSGKDDCDTDSVDNPRVMQAAAPYDDITVVELGETIAPAFVGKQLADLGARVLRVDDPTGAGLYAFPPIVGVDALGREVGAAYLHLCRNKRSVAIDAESEDGRRALRGLVEHADVVIDGLGVDRLKELGFA